MRRLFVCALVALLVGCGPQNTDPRKGRVVDQDDCFTGACYYDYKVCVGPDLFVSIDGDHGARRWIRNSRECKP